MYEDQTQNYDPDIQEEYLIHDTPFLLPHFISERYVHVRYFVVVRPSVVCL